MEICATGWTGWRRVIAVVAGVGAVGACGTDREAAAPAVDPEAVATSFAPAGPPPKPVVPVAEPVLASEEGEATFYADVLEGRPTASGEPMRQGAYVAAHRKYPFGTVLRVTNLENDRSVRVRVIDRGPFSAPMRAQSRVIDLSRKAAEELGFIDRGFAQVRVDVLRYGGGLRAT